MSDNLENQPLLPSPHIPPIPFITKDYIQPSSSRSYNIQDVQQDGLGKEYIYDNIYVDEYDFDCRWQDKRKHALGKFRATALCGNDLSSSFFYAIGGVLLVSGKWLPISLSIVVITMLIYKNAYAEVGTALTLNGGTYNILLNATNKSVAATAAALTILSYTSTAVVSANTAAVFGKILYDKLPVVYCTLGIILFFALLSLLGLGESVAVASAIFTIHLATLVLLVILSVKYFIQAGPSVLIENWHIPPIVNTPIDILFGFCNGLLGVSGFETSCNFIEEQADNVFPATLNGMVSILAAFNPTLGFLTIAILPIHLITKENQLLVLPMIAKVVGNDWLQTLLIVDSMLVLGGSVITSYVGFTGLVYRITLDRCLPQFLTQKNRFRNTNHWIILFFFLLCSSLYLIVHYDVSFLNSIYTISFLSVMLMFGIGNFILKYKRSSLPRKITAPVWSVIAGVILVFIAILGNIKQNPTELVYFVIYFGFTVTVMMFMLTRTRILKWLIDSFIGRCFGRQLGLLIQEINHPNMVFFTKTDNISVINKAILYVRDNELTSVLHVIHIYEDEKDIPSQLKFNVRILDEIYPKLNVDLYLIKGKFTPATVERLSQILNIPINNMYITTPSASFPFKLNQFGGVRLITH